MGKIYYCPQCGAIREYKREQELQYCSNCDNKIPFSKRHKNAILQIIKIDSIQLARKKDEPITSSGFTPTVYDFIWNNYVNIPSNTKLDYDLFKIHKDEVTNFFENGGYKKIKSVNPQMLPSKPQPKDASVIGRGVAGGLVAGPVGAVVGALSAVDKNNKNRSGK